MRRSVRERLADLLSEEFSATVLHLDIQGARGHWRSNRHAECWKWEATFVDDEGRTRIVGSYHTMGECVKYGITSSHVEGAIYEVDSKKPGVS